MPFRIKISLILLGAIFAALLIVPLLVPVPPLENVVPARDLAEPTSRFVTVPDRAGGIELHVEAFGPGVGSASEAATPATSPLPMLLVHGFGASLVTWDAVAADLAVDRTVVAYDRPAFGLTERATTWPRGANPYAPATQVEQVVALLDEFGISRAILVGHSAGGALAIRTALAHPDRVAGLVLVSPAIYRGGGAPAWSRPLLYTPQLSRIGPLLMRQLGGDPGRSLLRSAWADPDAVTDRVVERYARTYRVEGWDRALWEYTKASRAPISDARRLGMVSVPVLVATGLQDEVVPPEQSRRLATELPSAAYEEFDGCGHVVQEECPARFVAEVESWLADTSFDSVGTEVPDADSAAP